MPPTPRIAVMFDPDRLDFREQAVVRGIAGHARRAGWEVVLDPYAARHLPGGFSGLLAPVRKFSEKALLEATIPVVLLTRSRSALRGPAVAENRQAAGRLAAHHLLERGYRTFFYLGSSRSTGLVRERLEFRRALGRLGRPVEAVTTYETFSLSPSRFDRIVAGLDAWLGRLERPAGIFAARPSLARIVAQLALARGLRIPEDLGLVAADDDPVVSELPPALTSIRFDYADLGHRAAELLDRLLRGEPPPRRAILVEPTLVPRQSTDRQSVADDAVARALWFIDDRRTEAVGPREVAAHLGVPARTLQRRVRAAGRGTVQQEIAKARVEHAKLLLEDVARSRVRAQRRRRGPSPVRVVFDGPPGERGDEGWRQWAEDPRRREALVERRPDGTEWIRRVPLPMPDAPLVQRGHAALAYVARHSGFGSVSALSRAFRRYTGVCPSRWR